MPEAARESNEAAAPKISSAKAVHQGVDGWSSQSGLEVVEQVMHNEYGQ